MAAIRIVSPDPLRNGVVRRGVDDPHRPCLREFSEAVPKLGIYHNENSICFGHRKNTVPDLAYAGTPALSSAPSPAPKAVSIRAFRKSGTVPSPKATTFANLAKPTMTTASRI